MTMSMGELMRRIIDLKPLTMENPFEDEDGNFALKPGIYQIDRLTVKWGINSWHIVVEYHQLVQQPTFEEVAFSSPEEFAKAFGISGLS